MAEALANAIDCLLAAIMSVGRWLALPVIAILFLQWPLRDVVHCCSREANDAGQWLFAIYIAIAMTAATRGGVHLAADGWARRCSSCYRRRVRLLANIAVLIPFALFLLAASAQAVAGSVLMLERFPDTSNPGYFAVKLSLWLMAGLLLLQAASECLRSSRDKESGG